MVFRLIINITYSCVVYYTFTASVLLGHSYLPPTNATSVLLWCAYNQPMPTPVLPESACQLADPLPSQSC